MYPYLADAAMLYSADVSTAPDPDSVFWSQALVYSGYSGYPFLTDVFRTFIEPGVRSILSIPCATGDLFRLLTAEQLASLEVGVGVDILPRNVEFAGVRLQMPHLDLLNMTVCHAFLRHRKGMLNISLPTFLRAILESSGRTTDIEEAAEYYLQMQAAFAEVIISGAITDWFALLKGLGRLLTASPAPDIFQINVPEDGFAFCKSMAERTSPKTVREFLRVISADDVLDDPFAAGNVASQHFATGKVRFIQANMFELDLRQKFDCVFVWEAALMVAGVGREEVFLDRIDEHLNPGGTLVLTGLRSERHEWPRELQICQRLAARRGYRTVLTATTPRPATWAAGYIADAWFPVLLCEKKT